jgi:phosphate transport system substrate-binding protein
MLNIWGLNADGTGASPVLEVLTALEKHYQQEHPGVTFANHLNGNDSALGGLYVGVADIALMDREPSYIEIDGYQQAMPGRRPFEMQLMHGGIRTAGHSSPLVVVVNETNPVARLSLAEIDALFNAEPEAQRSKVRTWGDLGLAGSLFARPITLYGFAIDSAEAQTFSSKVMHNSRRWVCTYRELHATSSLQVASDIAEAVRHDPYAIGITTYDAASDGVRILAIGSSKDAFLPTQDALRAGQYVLARTVSVLARADENGHPEGKVHDFLEYLVSPSAQAIISHNGSYIALTEDAQMSARKALQ